MERTHLARALALLLVSSVAARAEVLLVQPAGPPGTFPTIADAVNAAVDGDVVLVRQGTYVSFLVEDKAISVVAAPGASVEVTAGARIFGLAPGKTVVLSGLTLRGTAAFSPTFAGTPLTMVGNEGSVRVEDCRLFAADNMHPPPTCAGPNGNRGWTGASVSWCTDVAFTGCTFLGGTGADMGLPTFGCGLTPGGNGGNGADLTGSHVAFFDCELTGGAGGVGAVGGLGGTGLNMFSGFAFVSGGALAGGPGAFGWAPLGGQGGKGGHGGWFVDATAAGIAPVNAVGGPGGPDIGGVSAPAGIALVGGPTLLHLGPARHLDFAVPVTGGHAFTASFEGAPHDFALLAMGTSALHVYVPAFAGVMLDAAPILIGGAKLDALGQGSLLVSTPALPAGQGFAVVLQSAFVTTDLAVRLGPARPQVLLPTAP